MEKRFITWRRSPEELKNLDTLGGAISSAKQTVEDGEYETVLVVEIKKVVKRAQTPVVVRNF